MVREVHCLDCDYKWLANSKRPDPRFITCPNCRANVELRPSKLEANWNKDKESYEVTDS